MKVSLLASILKGKCPVCRQGDAFLGKSIYDVKNMDKMPTNCSHCGHKFEREPGFWVGAMYSSYAITVAFSVAIFVLTFLIYPAASSWLYISIISVGMVVLAPVTFRLSRMMWMNFFSKYDATKQGTI